MNNLLFYRIITYILLFIAAFLSVGVFTSILAALANPAALLPFFLMACVIIYTYCSWRFLIRGIDKQIPVSKTVKDLIRVNGYITLALALFCLLSMIFVSGQPGAVSQVVDQLKQAKPPGLDLSDQELITRIQFTMRFLMIYSAVLLLHVFMTFRNMKRYADRFE